MNKTLDHLQEKIRDLVSPFTRSFEIHGATQIGDTDEYSDIDIKATCKELPKDFERIKKMFKKQQNYILSFTLPYFSERIVNTSFWNIDDKPYVADISFEPSEKNTADLSTIDEDPFFRFTGLCWHCFVAFKRKDYIELGRQMSHVRELHLFPLVEKKYKLESTKKIKTKIPKNEYSRLISTYCDFNNDSKARTAIFELMILTQNYYGKKDNTILEYIKKEI